MRRTHNNLYEFMRKRTLFSLLLCILVGINAVAWKISPFRNSTTTGGYHFMLYTPNEAEVDSAPRLPLVVFLHGASLCGSDLRRVERYGPLDAVHKGLDIPAYVLAPQTSNSWHPEKVLRTIEWVEDHYRIDSSRVYVIGMSLGGFGTMDFASTYPNLVAAAMPICGGASRPVAGLAKVPTWIIHGTADRPVPISKSDAVAAEIRKINKGERLIYTRLPGVDHGQPARLFYRHELYEWLLEHSLTDSLRPVNRRYVIDNATLYNAYRNLPGHGRNIR